MSQLCLIEKRQIFVVQGCSACHCDYSIPCGSVSVKPQIYRRGPSLFRYCAYSIARCAVAVKCQIVNAL